MLGALALGTFSLTASPQAAASVRKPHRTILVPRETVSIQVPITVHVATTEGLPVVPRREVLAAVARANRELRGYGIELRLRAVEPVYPLTAGLSPSATAGRRFQQLVRDHVLRDKLVDPLLVVAQE